MVLDPSSVTIGIDAAVVANHRVAVRGSDAAEGVKDDFSVSPTLSGLEKLADRLGEYAGAMVVAEPTAMTWLSLGHTVAEAGCVFSLVEARHTSKLREALAGRNKTDVIDAEMLAAAAGLFGLEPASLPTPGQVALRRAVRRRHHITAEAHNADVRLWALAAWAFPDLWRAMAGSHRLARTVFSHWPHLDQLARARTATVAALCRSYLRNRGDATDRADRIREAARGWARFWTGRMDLDALAWELTQMLDDLDTADLRETEATRQAAKLWRDCYGPDDLLCSVSGIGQITAPVVRAYMGDATQFRGSKQAVAYVGLNPSNWESGLMASPSRPITKEGPPELRLAFYQAANVARQIDPQLAAFYQRMMCEKGHHHIQATSATARKLVARVWATLTSGRPYQLRTVDGDPIDPEQARIIARTYQVPDHVRRRTRARNQHRRGRLSG